MTSSQIGRFFIIIIGFGALVAAAYIIYSILTYIRREIGKEKGDKNGN
jgi:ABC-type multidrug transport system permease subunit